MSATVLIFTTASDQMWHIAFSSIYEAQAFVENHLPANWAYTLAPLVTDLKVARRALKALTDG